MISGNNKQPDSKSDKILQYLKIGDLSNT